MSTAYNIHLMHMSMDLRETLREQERQRREQRWAERQELDSLIKRIENFFPAGKAGDRAYVKWVDAGPDDNAGFLQYCRDEWARIVDEIVFAHKLAGYSLAIE